MAVKSQLCINSRDPGYLSLEPRKQQDLLFLDPEETFFTELMVEWKYSHVTARISGESETALSALNKESDGTTSLEKKPDLNGSRGEKAALEKSPVSTESYKAMKVLRQETGGHSSKEQQCPVSLSATQGDDDYLSPFALLRAEVPILLKESQDFSDLPAFLQGTEESPRCKPQFDSCVDIMWELWRPLAVPVLPMLVGWCVENYTGARCEEVFLPSSSIQTKSNLFTAFVALAVLVTLTITALYFLCR
ncbi:Pro-neuregulin-4, membrane-bound isoform [Fukomys damarensis]|uniref:Pro-neuregulin-4, membrane-bound isoform n=1 Tax=Fukomys damarensis TaxID=885580 RepID=A0A091E5T5_FUKDA|nr:Pro-neuregulin-4, membrane-bound isoform [Fukomys damarensis]